MLAGFIPAAYGAVCGWLLGVNKTAYTIATLLGIVGGYFAGLEHDRALEGAVRGTFGGALFGGFILIVHEAIGNAAKAKLPHPEIILVAITTAFGAALGTMGARRRARHVEEEGPAFDIRRIHRSELIGFGGSAVLLGSMFLNWFSTSCATGAAAKISQMHGESMCNPHAKINNAYGSFNAFQTYKTLDVLLVLACIAPFVLAYIIARGHDLTWRPGEITMIVGIVAFTLILVNGVVLGKPGTTKSELSFEIGYLVGLAGSLLISVGGFARQAMSIKSRKPPGVM